MKTCGHVVVEKAVVKGINASLLVCGDVSPQGNAAVTGRLKGGLASFFQKNFVKGIYEYGEDFLQAAVFNYSMSPAGKAPLIGPGSEFGSGCSGILAAGKYAYVYVNEGSGMCIVRLADVFGKRKFVRVLSSSSGGEEIMDLYEGALIMAIPESWMDGSQRVLDDYKGLFDPAGISSDKNFDRHLYELANEGFKGCAAALLVRQVS